MPTTLILDKHPEFLRTPYSKRVNLRSKASPLVVTVKGKTSGDPFQFAIDVVEDGNILFHMNPRWSEGRTVFNTCLSNGWGQPEYAFFSSLTPNCSFTIVITATSDSFKVKVNNEAQVVFRARTAPKGNSREIRVCKVDKKDISLQHVQLDEC